MTFRRIWLAAFAAASLWTGSAFAADQYEIDPAHSSVGFVVKHMMVSNVRGNFGDFSGTIMYDAKDASKSSVKVVVKAASINTGNAKRDEHLRSADFFDAATYPEITFQSAKVEKKGDGFVATGQLTMKGVTKTVSLPFSLTGPIKDSRGKSRLGVDSGLEVNRQDYGISWNKTLDTGGVVVSDNVKVELGVEAVN